MQKNFEKTKKMIIIAMLTAMAYAVMAVIHIPVSFLTYDPKAVVISIGGMLYGPLVSLFISIGVGLLEMITISDTGFIGAIMNIVYAAVFSCTAAIIYKKKHTMSGAYLGLFFGIIFSTITMILWNILLTPIYLGSTINDILPMLIPLLIPFNLIKGGINAAATALLYKPIVKALRMAKLLPKTEASENNESKNTRLILWIVALLSFILLSFALVVFSLSFKAAA